MRTAGRLALVVSAIGHGAAWADGPAAPAAGGAAAAPSAPAPAPAAHPDFTGVWKIDLDASEVPDDMMKAQGLSWVERQAAKSISVTQKIRQEADRITILVQSSVKTKQETIPIGGPWVEREGEMAGKVRTRTSWSGDGRALVTTTELKLKDGTPAEARLVRSLDDGGRTMMQRIELRTKDGRSWVARRVFRKAG